MDEWIAVKDKMPEKKKWYLAAYPSKDYTVFGETYTDPEMMVVAYWSGEINSNGLIWYDNCEDDFYTNITHYRDLPDGPY